MNPTGRKVLFLLFLFGCHLLSAQSTRLTGKVIDAASRQPLIGASLFLQSDLLGGTLSDQEGTFELHAIGPERDTLVVSYMGYLSVKMEIMPQVISPLVIELIPIPLEIQAVEIKARRIIAEEFSVQTLKKLDIYKNPNAKADPLLAVQSMPVSTTADESANVSLRGSPPHETGIFLNNVPIKDAVRLDQVNGVGQFSIFNTGMIKSLHVFPSNPPLELGNATSGAVVLNTSDNLPGKTNSLLATLANVGISGSRNIGSQSGLSYYANASTQHGLKALNPTAFEAIKSFHSIDAGWNFIHHLNPQTRIKVFNYSLIESYAYRYRHPSFSGFFNQVKNRNMSIANFTKESDINFWEANFLYDWSQSGFSVGNLDLSLGNQNVYGSINYNHFFDKFSLKTGVSYDQVNEDIQAVFPTYSHALGPEHPSQPFDSITNYSIPEAFGYAKYRFGELVVGGGIRYHLSNTHIPSWLSYQANVHWRFADYQKVLLSGGKYYKIHAEEGHKIESHHLALEYHYEKKQWKGTGSLYFKRSKYLQIENPIFGAEIFASFNGKFFQGSISFAHIQAQLDNREEVLPSDYDFDYFLRVIAKYNLQDWVEISLIYLNRQGQYFQGLERAEYHGLTETWKPYYASRTETGRLADYRLLDLSISKTFLLGEGSCILFVSANNVFNRKNIRGYSYNFNYTEKIAELFNRRVVFIGGVWSF